MSNEVLIKVFTEMEKVMPASRNGLCGIPLISVKHILTICSTKKKKSIEFNFSKTVTTFQHWNTLYWTENFPFHIWIHSGVNREWVRTAWPSCQDAVQRNTEITVFCGSEKQFDTKRRHFSSQVSVSHYPWPPPRHITTASSASWLRVSEASRKLFSPTRLLLFFSTPLELSAANSSAWGHDSVPHGEELWSPPTYPPATSKPPPPCTSTFFTSLYFLICSVDITKCLRGKSSSFPTKVKNICLD